jgi:hypothetical protein
MQAFNGFVFYLIQSLKLLTVLSSIVFGVTLMQECEWLKERSDHNEQVMYQTRMSVSAIIRNLNNCLDRYAILFFTDKTTGLNKYIHIQSQRTMNVTVRRLPVNGATV